MSDPFASFRLNGRTALVTGARREIGRAIALGLASAGARLAIHHAGTIQESSDAATVV
jgi:NAD(P)-dependent dehydrogenase (short-subunit alcohol dehydrogenase family)